jgi:hypothetical protein
MKLEAVMRRMRIMLDGVTAFSLFPCLATCGPWVRSFGTAT